MEIKLTGGYSIREMEEDKFIELQAPLREKVFSADHSIFPFSTMTNDEQSKVGELGKDFYNKQYKLFLGVFDSQDNFVGWHFGFQENAHVFYMCNSAIAPGHRRKGLYASLLDETLKILIQKGFQIIYSRHNATNNSVIIPKLKAGFIISSMELSDIFGVLVHLKYFTNKTRRKLMDYRAGQIAPDEELESLFK